MDITENSDESMEKGFAPDIVSDFFSEGVWQRTSVCVPSEMALTIYVNGLELVTIMCTPTKLKPLVLGFLYSEGIIKTIKDVASMQVHIDDSLVDVKLNTPDFKMPSKRTLTSGLGGGHSFLTQVQRVVSNQSVTLAEILALMNKLENQGELHKRCGGVHTSALADNRNLLVVAEDIGRHNTLFRIQGECLSKNISTKNRLLLTTGRISSEMLVKAAKMETPIVVSLSSPTERSVSLACDLGITIIGYARINRLYVYSHPERIVPG